MKKNLFISMAVLLGIGMTGWVATVQFAEIAFADYDQYCSSHGGVCMEFAEPPWCRHDTGTSKLCDPGEHLYRYYSGQCQGYSNVCCGVQVVGPVCAYPS